MESLEEDITMVVESEALDKNVEHENKDSTVPNQQDHRTAANVESAQAKVLRNFELLDLIMSFMIDASSSLTPHLPLAQPDSVDLLWASLTCRAFFDPAMNALWRSMDSWPAILQLIPTLTKEENAVTGAYTTSEVILEEHLERLSWYTRRIRHFSFSPFIESVSPHIYTSLTHLRNYGLFPGLLTLDITNFGEACISNMPPFSLFLSPTLTSVAIRLIQPSNAEVIAASILHMVASNCPSVRNIVLNGHITNLCLDTLVKNKTLEQLEINTAETDMSSSFFRKLTSIQHLKSLVVFMKKPIQLNDPNHNPKSITFPCLETIQLHGPSNAVFYILRNMSPGRISSLSLDFTSTPEGDDAFAQSCLEILGQMGAYHSLRSTSISSEENSIISRGIMIDHLKKYGPQLESIDVETDTLLYDNLQTLCSQAYGPNLKYLKYVTQRASRLSRPTHLSKLGIFTRYFPNIETLHIPVALNMSKEEIELLRTEIKGERRCHGLREVVLRPQGINYDPAYKSLQNNPGTLTASNALVVGNYLNYIFPHLKAVNLSRFSAIDENWREAVESVVMELQRERRRLDGRDLCCKTCTQ